MLRSLVVALTCLAVMPSIAARAEVTPAEPAAPIIAAAAKATAVATEPGDSAAQTKTESAAEPAKEEAAKDGPGKDGPAKEAAKPAPQAEPTLTALVDLARQTIVVSEHGDVKYTWPISSGAEGYATPRGTFHPQWIAKMWYSKQYDNAPMPNAVFINGGVAIHATPHVSSLGRPASHGCIRLAPGNAKIFYGLVQAHGLKMTRVSIYGTPKFRAPAVANRDQPRRRYTGREEQDSWFGKKQYRPVSAYDQGFANSSYRQAPRYYYADAPQRVYYRRADDNRYYYVQRPQRRVYYYRNNGYGGGW